MKPGFQQVPPGAYYYLEAFQSPVKKMKKNILAILFTIILLASPLTGLDHALGETVGNPEQVAGTMLNLLENSHSEVTTLLGEINATGGTIPEDAQEAYSEALRLRVQAEEEYNLGQYGEAIETTMEAMEKYGEVALEIYGNGTEDEVEEIRAYFSAIDRTHARIMKLTEITSDLSIQGINVTMAETLLGVANETLTEVRASLDAGNFTLVRELLGEANGLLGEINGILRRLSAEKKQDKTERFIVRTKSMIQNLENRLNRVLNKYNISGEDQEIIQAQFREIQSRLDGLDPLEDLDDVIDDLAEIVEESREIGEDEDELEDEVENLWRVNREEAKVERYRDRIEELAERGVNTTALEEQLAKAEEALMDAEETLEETDGIPDDLEDEVEEALEDAEEALEDAEEALEDAEEILNDLDDDSGDDSFKQVLSEVYEMLDAIQSNIDVLSELDQDTEELGERLSELKALVEDAVDIESMDELLDAEEEIWRLFNETRTRLGEPPMERPMDDNHHDDDDHPDDNGGHPDDDDHPDDDHPDDDHNGN